MKPLNPNSMIQGRYLIVQPIGKGGMGEVYLAVDQRLGSAVALKRTFFSEDSSLGSAFEREARILARLRHPVLPKVIDHFAENGDQFLVMEHISGDDIAKRIEAAKKPFPVGWVMFWADQMLDALAYLHSHEPPIVHRDIKPQNLKLTDDNHIVLLDFGLSKDFDTNSSGLNSASVAGYSPHFASMEQIRGTGTDARSDLYSLSATLYQMLTNHVPPDALTRADSLLGGQGDPIQPLNDLNPDISSAVSDVILKAVSIRQDERYSTAGEMQKALRRAYNLSANKADIDAKPVMTATGAPAPPSDNKAASKPQPAEQHTTVPDAPEFETKIRAESPLPLDATLHLDITPKPAAMKQSELQTAVFDAGELVKEVRAETSTRSTPVSPAAPPVSATTAAPPVAIAASAAAQPARPAPRPIAAPISPAARPKKKSKVGLIVGLLVGLLLLAGVGGGAVWFLMIRSKTAGTNVATPAPANVSTSAPTPVATAETNEKPPSNSGTELGVQPTMNEAENRSSSGEYDSHDTSGKPANSTGREQTPAGEANTEYDRQNTA